jgi:ligand-binding sensor domain-containing protein
MAERTGRGVEKPACMIWFSSTLQIRQSIAMKRRTIHFILAALMLPLLWASCQSQAGGQLGRSVSEIPSCIRAIYQDTRGLYWFGSNEQGVFTFDGTEIRQYTIEDDLFSNGVLGIQEDRKGRIFIESVGGLTIIDRDSLFTIDARSALPGAWLPWPAGLDDLWFGLGFFHAGPFRFDGQVLHAHTLPRSPQEEQFYADHGAVTYAPNGLYSIYRAKDSALWFGTASVGFCRYDGQSFSWHYEPQLQTTPEGGDFGMRSIIEDEDGKYWLNNTRYRYDFQNDGGEWLQYEKQAGVSGEINGKDGYIPWAQKVVRDKDNAIWIQTYENGVWKLAGDTLIQYPVTLEGEPVRLRTIALDQSGALWIGSENAGVFRLQNDVLRKWEFSPVPQSESY